MLGATAVSALAAAGGLALNGVAVAQTGPQPLPPALTVPGGADTGVGAAPGAGPAYGGGAEPAGTPRSVIPWLDKALSGDPSALQPPAGPAPSAGGGTGYSGAGPSAGAPIDPTAPVAGAETPPVAGLPGRAPGAEGSDSGAYSGGYSGGYSGAAQPGGPAAGGGLSGYEEAATAPRIPSGGAFSRAPAAGGGAGGIEVAPINELSAASAGVLSAEQVGLPVNAWTGTVESDAIAIIEDLAPGPFHRANRLAIRLLSAALEPPRIDEASEEDLLDARLDALLRFGAAERAAEVAEAAGRERLVQEAVPALISGRDGAFCEAAVTEPDADSLARIYCQGVLGDRLGAITAIDASRALGADDPATLELLEAVADPELAAYVTPPKGLSGLTPTTLAAMRRLGQDLPADFARAAPLRLMPAALDPGAPPRIRLEALERLEQAGAVDTATLAEAWRQTPSAESGGVWGRVEAYRAALTAPDDGFAAAVAVAAQRAEEAGRLDVMARLLGPEIAARAFPASGVPTQGLDTPQIRRLLRLAGESDTASALLRATARSAGPEERALDHVAAAHPSTEWNAADVEPLLARAARGDREAGRVMAGLNAFGVPTMAPDFFEGARDVSFELNEGRAAAIAFRALVDITRGGADIAPERLHASLQRLITLGFAEDARQIATEAAILGR